MSAKLGWHQQIPKTYQRPISLDAESDIYTSSILEKKTRKNIAQLWRKHTANNPAGTAIHRLLRVPEDSTDGINNVLFLRSITTPPRRHCHCRYRRSSSSWTCTWFDPSQSKGRSMIDSIGWGSRDQMIRGVVIERTEKQNLWGGEGGERRENNRVRKRERS